jgi:hypothetical protein
MTAETLAKVAQALGAGIEVRLNWRGEGVDRLLDQEHASLVEAFARRLRASDWEVRTEVTFWIRGERGSVDILAWHPESRITLLVEIKSVVPDLQAMVGALDRKARLGLEIAASVGWRAVGVGRVLVIGETRTARRRVETYRSTFDAAFPDRFVEVRRFLAAPWTGPDLRGLVFLPGSHRLTTRHRQSALGVSRERGSIVDRQ